MQRMSPVTEKSIVAPGALVHLISTSDDDLGLQDRLRRRSARRACGAASKLGMGRHGRGHPIFMARSSLGRKARDEAWAARSRRRRSCIVMDWFASIGLQKDTIG